MNKIINLYNYLEIKMQGHMSISRENLSFEQQKIYKEAKVAQKHYKKLIRKLRHSGNKKLRFAAYVVYASTFGMDCIFDLMLKE